MCLSPCIRSITCRCHIASPRVLWSCGYRWVWVAGHGAWQLSWVLFVHLSLPPLRFLIDDWSVSANFALVWGHRDIQFTALSVLNSVTLVWQTRVFIFSWPLRPQMLLWVVLPDTVWSELFQRRSFMIDGSQCESSSSRLSRGVFFGFVLLGFGFKRDSSV